MNWQSEIVRATLIGLVYLLLFFTAEVWRRKSSPGSESSRKLVHLGGGLISLSLIYLLQSHWSVLLLCIIFAGIMYGSKKLGMLQSVHGVERSSAGSFYFPVAVYLTFYLSSLLQQPHFYLIAILVLAVSDTMAALVGKSYGFKLYQVEQETRSLEGSLFFLISTFLLVHLGLLLLTETGRLESVLIALLIAILVTAFESVSLGGADNLFIPLGTLFMLMRNTDKTASFILLQFLLLAVISLITWLLCRQSGKIGSSGIIGLTLLTYAAAAMMGLTWFLPMISAVLLITATNLFLGPPRRRRDFHRIQRVSYFAVTPFLWVLSANFFHSSVHYLFYLPYLASITVSLSILWHWSSRQQTSAAQAGGKTALPLIARALLLSVLFASLQLLFLRELAAVYSLVLLFAATAGGDLLYWFVAAKQVRKWPRVAYLRLGLAIVAAVTLLLFVAQLLYYRPEQLLLR